MKKFLLYVIAALALVPAYSASKVGCMSRSQHLADRYDYKTLHFVECSCPCGSSSRYAMLQNRGVCKECGHFHAIKPIELIKGSIPKQAPRKPRNMFARFFYDRGGLISLINP